MNVIIYIFHELTRKMTGNEPSVLGDLVAGCGALHGSDSITQHWISDVVGGSDRNGPKR